MDTTKIIKTSYYGENYETFLSELAIAYKNKKKIHLIDDRNLGINPRIHTLLAMGVSQTIGYSLSSHNWAVILDSLNLPENMMGDLVYLIDEGLTSNSGSPSSLNPNTELIKILVFNRRFLPLFIFMPIQIAFYYRHIRAIRILTHAIPREVIPFNNSTEFEISW